MLPFASVSGYPGSFPFTVILERDTANEEVCTVTGISGLNATVTRGSDGTTAISHSNGATVEHGMSARDLNEPQVHIAASSVVHGLAGAVVGTTDTQTLTNKTLVTPIIDGSVGALTLPAGPDTLVARATTDTLTNKTLTTPIITNPTLSGSGGTLTLPAGPDTIVGRATTDTLTNKTLTAPTITSATVTGATLDATSTLGGVSGTTLAALASAESTHPTYIESHVFTSAVNNISSNSDYATVTSSNTFLGVGTYLLEFYYPLWSASVGGSQWTILPIVNTGAQLSSHDLGTSNAVGGTTMPGGSARVIWSPGSDTATPTFHFQAHNRSGGGTTSMALAANVPAFLLVTRLA